MKFLYRCYVGHTKEYHANGLCPRCPTCGRLMSRYTPPYNEQVKAMERARGSTSDSSPAPSPAPYDSFSGASWAVPDPSPAPAPSSDSFSSGGGGDFSGGGSSGDY